MPGKAFGIQPAFRLVLIIAVCAFIDETLIMFLMGFMPSFPFWVQALIDASLLVILLSPVLYFGLFRSLSGMIEQQRQVEEALKEHRDHLEELVNARTSEISALFECAQAVLKNCEFNVSAGLIFEKCKQTIGTQAGYITLLDKTGTKNEICYLDSGGLPCTVDQSLPMPIRGFRKEAFEKGRVVFENRFSESQWQQFMPEGHVSCKNVLFAPLLIDDKPIGLLGLANKPSDFNENDARMATAFAELSSIALLNSRNIEALTSSEERFRSVVESARDAIVSINNEGHVIFWNQSAEKLFGYTSDEFIGEPVTRIIPQKFHQAHKDALKRAVGQGKLSLVGKTQKYNGIKKDGSEFPLEISLASWKSSEDIFFTGIIRDISEHIQVENFLKNARAELENQVVERTSKLITLNSKLRNEIEERKSVVEKLKRNQQMLQAVFDGISDPLFLVDSQMRIKIMNKSATAYYGISETECIYGKFCYETAGKPGPCDACQIPLAVTEGKSVTFERKNLDHPEQLEQVFINSVKENPNQTSDFIIRITDITEARKLERMLVHSEKMASLGVLVSSIAHEINNPNNFVTFNMPILRDYIQQMLPIVDSYAEQHPALELCHMPYPEFREDIFKLIGNVEHGSARISSFVSNLREFSQSGGSKPFSWVNPTALIKKTISLCQSKIQKAVKSFILDIPDGLPNIYTDQYSLEQILINLLLNSVQAADKPDSWVKFEARVTDEWKNHAVIRISDNGCGIEPDVKRKIFDPFFTTKLSAEGTGLGLYVVHNLLAALGGRIEVTSEPGKGSIFTVTLPDKERRQKPRA